jgi:hypothetical protein
MDVASPAVVGFAAEVARIREENLQGAIIQLKSAFEGLLIAIGEPLLQPLKEIVLAVAQMTRDIRDLVKENEILVSVLTAVGLTFGSLLAAFGAILLPLGLAVALFGKLGEVWLGGMKHIKNFVFWLGRMTASMYAAVAASTALRLAVASVGVALAGLAIYKFVAAIKESAEEMEAAAEAYRKANEELDKTIALLDKFKDVVPIEDLSEFHQTLDVEGLKAHQKEVKGLVDYHVQFGRQLKLNIEEQERLIDAMDVDTEGPVDPEQLKLLEEERKKLDKLKTAFLLNQVNVERYRKSLERIPDTLADITKKTKELELTALEIKLRREALEETVKLRRSITDTEVEIKEAGLKEELKEEIKKFKKIEIYSKLSAEERAEHISLLEEKTRQEILDLWITHYRKRFDVYQKLAEDEAEITRVQSDEQVSITQEQYDQQLITAKEYYEQRREIAKKQTEEEVKLLEAAKLAPGLKPEEKAAIDIQIKITRVEGDVTLAEITRDETTDALAVEDQYLQQRKDLHQAYLDDTDPEAASEFRLQQLSNQYAAQLQLYSQYVEDENAVRELGEAMERDIEMRRTEFARAQAQLRVQLAQQSLGYLQSLLSDIYTAGGKELKALFYAERAVAAAEAIISAYSAANKAMDSPMMKKHPTLAMAYAQLVFSTGIARAAAIMTTAIREARKGGMIEVQQFVKGGVVKLQDAGRMIEMPVQKFAHGGRVALQKIAPSARIRRYAEGKGRKLVPVRLTDREYVFSPEAVSHYGARVMEQINRRRLQVTDVVSQVRSRVRQSPAAGLVTGPKGIDKVFTYLQDRQFVIRPEAVKHYGVKFLQALEDGVVDVEKLARLTLRVSRPEVMREEGVSPQRFQEGGIVEGTAAQVPPEVRAVAEGGGGVTINVPVSVTGQVEDPEALAALLQEEMEEAAIRVMKEQMR